MAGALLEAHGAAGALVEVVAIAQSWSELDDGVLGAGAVAAVALVAVAAGEAALRLERRLALAEARGHLVEARGAPRSFEVLLRSLRGESYLKPPKHDLATFDKLHVWYYTDAAQRPQGHLDMKKRQSSFEEVVAGLSQKEAVYEAKRCLSCGNCYECDGCYGACPEDAIIKLGPGRRYRYNYDLCTGCAVCFEQCPCHAIEMIPEPAAGE